MKCDSCGRKLGIIEKHYRSLDGRILCFMCHKKNSAQLKKMIIEHEKEKTLVKSEFDLLNEILTVNKEQLKKLDTIRKILIFFAILVILAIIALFASIPFR